MQGAVFGITLWVATAAAEAVAAQTGSSTASSPTATAAAAFADSVKLLSDEIARTADLGEMKIVSDCLVRTSWYAWGGSLVATFSFADMGFAITDDYDPIEDIDVMGLACRSPGCVASLSMRGFAYQDDLFEFSIWHDARDAVTAALLEALKSCGVTTGAN